MPAIVNRGVIPLQPGNGSNVIINGAHFNATALRHFNYTLYSNGTLSNDSQCWLVFDGFQPRMNADGHFTNTTSCYSAIGNLQANGMLGMSFAVLFAVSIIATLINLRKHGKTYLPREKRWNAVSRRWQWYWLLFVAACGTISGFMSIDVDRYYLQSLPLILQSLFYFLMLPPSMAAVWEGVRHWASWEERQIYDRNPAELPVESTRETQEFLLPLIFYAFAWLNFFLAIPRRWTPVQFQRSPEQQDALARPTATDARFKAASFMALAGFLVISYSLAHSVHHYRPVCHNTRSARRACSRVRAAPVKFILVITMLAINIAYTIASAFDWYISPIKFDANVAWIYCLGYAPILLIIFVLNFFGLKEPNDDQALITLRQERNRRLDPQLGLTLRKPIRADYRPPASDEDGELKAFAVEFGESRDPQRGDLELTVMEQSDPGHKTDEDVAVTAAESGSSTLVPSGHSDQRDSSSSGSVPRVRSMLDL